MIWIPLDLPDILSGDWKLMKRSIRHWWQRRTRGWDDTETWCLNHSMAAWIIPRLRRFQQINCILPEEFKTEAEWDAALDKMIRAMELFNRDWGWGMNEEEQQEFIEGINLFNEYWLRLWW